MTKTIHYTCDWCTRDIEGFESTPEFCPGVTVFVAGLCVLHHTDLCRRCDHALKREVRSAVDRVRLDAQTPKGGSA